MKKIFALFILLGSTLCSIGALAAPPNWYGWGPCNLGLYENSQNAAAVTREKALSLWPGDPDWYSWGALSTSSSSNNIETQYFYPHRGRHSAIWGGNVVSYSWVACSVRECPTGYERWNGECKMVCGNGEVRDDDGACVCPQGLACPNQDLGPCGDGTGAPSASVGNPINMAIANKYQVEIDYQNPVNPLLRIQRTYNSQSTHSGYVGTSWFWNFGSKLAFQPGANPPKLRAQRPDGRVFSFTRLGGNWVPDSATRDRVTGWGPSGFQYHPWGSDTVESYDVNGRLMGVRDGKGNGYTLTYQPFSRPYPKVPRYEIAKITDFFGRSLTLTYFRSGRIETITDPEGGVYRYNYSSARPSVVTDPFGNRRVYRYNEQEFTGGADLPNALTGLEDQRGIRYASWYYDAEGRVVGSERGNGQERTTIKYREDGSTTVTNALGKETTYHYELIRGQRKISHVEGHPSSHCAAADRSYTYTPEGWLASKTDWNGNITTYAYDGRGRQISRTEAAGTPVARLIETQWHPTLNVKTRIIEPHRTTTREYDDNGRLISKSTLATP
jgi:YD repeat-containing protein